jgi:hypothetical protein
MAQGKGEFVFAPNQSCRWLFSAGNKARWHFFSRQKRDGTFSPGCNKARWHFFSRPMATLQPAG